MGVILVGFAMFLAYLYSQGKIQAIWEDAFGSGSSSANNATNNNTAAANNTTAQPIGVSASTPEVTPNSLASSVVVPSLPNIAVEPATAASQQLSMTPEPFSNSSLAFPQVAAS